MRTVRRLRLRCFSFNIYSDVLSTCLLLTLSMLVQAHQKDFSTYPMLGSSFPKHNLHNLDHNRWSALRAWDKSPFGGPGRYCPAVQNPFGFASYSNNLTSQFWHQFFLHPVLRLIFWIKKRTANFALLVYPKPSIGIHASIAILDQFHACIY